MHRRSFIQWTVNTISGLMLSVIRSSRLAPGTTMADAVGDNRALPLHRLASIKMSRAGIGIPVMELQPGEDARYRSPVIQWVDPDDGRDWA